MLLLTKDYSVNGFLNASLQESAAHTDEVLHTNHVLFVSSVAILNALETAD